MGVMGGVFKPVEFLDGCIKLVVILFHQFRGRVIILPPGHEVNRDRNSGV